jgi:hypothetical protein
VSPQDRPEEILGVYVKGNEHHAFSVPYERLLTVSAYNPPAR